MHNHIAFLDEWGNNGLDFTKQQVSTHFIVVALTLPKDRINEAEAVTESVRQRFFQKGPIKSSKVGDDAKRRKLVLAALLNAPFQIFALIVDKRQLISEGLRYKSSFYKFLHGLADRELYRTFPNIDLVADTHGSETFMAGFIQYVQANHIPNLFNQASFGFVNDQGSILVQAADFIAGSLARCYDETVISDQRQSFIELLRPKLLMLKYWPDVFAPPLVTTSLNQTQYNPLLADLGINLALDFVHRNASKRSPQEVDQLTCLNYLLFHFRHIDPTKYISSRELIRHIEDRRNATLTLHYFQTKVIASLRDAGILIASSTKGYKLPACESDLHDFVNHSNTIIQPLLSRINKCRNQVRLATDDTIDILDHTEYDNLRRLIEY